jgi:nitroreductase
MLKDIVAASRSYRRFDGSVAVPMTVLEELVDLARLCPSAANRQPLRFILCNDPADREAVFACLKWAAYLKDWDGPAPSERPAAYVIVVNTARDWDMARIDQGIMAQTMLLGAVEKGLGGCMLGAIDRERLRDHLGLDPDLEICLILALGKPAEDVRIVDLPADGSIRYWRDEAGTQFVPKRSRQELVLEKRGK